MSQNIWSTIDVFNTNGTELGALLDGFKDAVVSGMSGTARPANLQAGGMWLDTTLEASPDYKWSVKIFDGTSDIELFVVNINTNTAGMAGAADSFQIEKISADTAAPILKLLKERIANNGQVLSGDVVGEIQFVGAASDNSNPIVAKIKSIATENETNVANGACLVFETTADGTNALVEAMRLIEGKLGIGTNAPEAEIHVKGQVGIKAERSSNDTVGPQVILKKKRIAGSGQVLFGDKVGSHVFKSMDDTGTEFETAAIIVEADENHTTALQGSRVSIWNKVLGTNTMFESLRVSDIVESYLPMKAPDGQFTTFTATAMYGRIALMALATGAEAAAASITQLPINQCVTEITGSTTTTIRGITNPGGFEIFIVITNRMTSNNVILKHEDGAAASNERIATPAGVDIVLKPGCSIFLIFNGGLDRWLAISLGASTEGYEALTLSGGDITNQYKDLAQVANTGTIQVHYNGMWQRPTSDYTISYTGGAGGNTRISFAGDLASGLASGDVLHINYKY